MPVYCYSCRTCKESYEIKHSMSDEHTTCLKCGSEEIFKKPSLLDTKIKINHRKKVGKIVDEYISNTKKEIKKEKKHLQSREL